MIAKRLESTGEPLRPQGGASASARTESETGLKTLKIVNAALLALFATLALVLAVVWLLYAVNLEAAPRLKPQMPTLSAMLGIFFVLTLFAGTAFHGLRRARPWRWIAQAAFAGALAPAALLLYRLVS